MDFESHDQMPLFQRQLEETQAWCASQDWSANPAEKLRTPLFRPSKLSVIEHTFHDADMFWKTTPQQRQQIVEQLALKRAALLQKSAIPLLPPTKPLTGGRLLIFSPDNTLSDGAATVATQGFFDWDNLPAWDTWISYVTNDPVASMSSGDSFDSYLLSWVPNPLVEVVASGIMANPEACIAWCSELDSAFIRRLKQAGLMH